MIKNLNKICKFIICLISILFISACSSKEKNEKSSNKKESYQYTIYNDKEIVVREEVLEDVVYLLLKNNIEISQIRNLGERIKLYEGEGVL